MLQNSRQAKLNAPKFQTIKKGSTFPDNQNKYSKFQAMKNKCSKFPDNQNKCSEILGNQNKDSQFFWLSIKSPENFRQTKLYAPKFQTIKKKASNV